MFYFFPHTVSDSRTLGNCLGIFAGLKKKKKQLKQIISEFFWNLSHGRQLEIGAGGAWRGSRNEEDSLLKPRRDGSSGQAGVERMGWRSSVGLEAMAGGSPRPLGSRTWWRFRASPVGWKQELQRTTWTHFENPTTTTMDWRQRAFAPFPGAF